MTLQHGQRVPIEYYTFSERHRRRTSIFYVDWLWYGPPKLWRRNSCKGVWDTLELQVSDKKWGDVTQASMSKGVVDNDSSGGVKAEVGGEER